MFIFIFIFIFIGTIYNLASIEGASFIAPTLLIAGYPLWNINGCDIENSVSLLEDITSQSSSERLFCISNYWA